MRKGLIIVAATFGALLGLYYLGFFNSVDSAIKSSQKAEAGKISKGGDYVEYGNGIYFFVSNGEDFARNLSNFLSTHDSLEVRAIAEQTAISPSGYIVVFERK